jgi:hypothetical protein
VWREIATCKVCGWRGWIIHHNPERCARYLKIRQMYLAGMTSRAIGRELGSSNTLVIHVLRAVGVKTRPPGGLNNPGGINGRSRLTPLRRPEVNNS